VYGWRHVVASCTDPCREGNTRSKSHWRNNEPLREQQETAIGPSADGQRVNYCTISLTQRELILTESSEDLLVEMNRDKELARLKPWAEKAQRFTGWDLSHVKPKPIDPGPPWNYEDIVRDYAVGKKHALDMGTGGAEFLSRVRHLLPPRTVATEEWKVNAPIAKRRLDPLDVDTVRCKSLKLPFASSAFDLVINRHEELDPEEVARVLSTGGHVVTQQVGDNWSELRRFFPRAPDFSNIYPEYVRGFETVSLRLIQNIQHYYKVAYQGLGELVYLLSVAPWEVPGFAVERDLDALLSLESELSKPEGLVLTESRFLIIAQK